MQIYASTKIKGDLNGYYENRQSYDSGTLGALCLEPDSKLSATNDKRELRMGAYKKQRVIDVLDGGEQFNFQPGRLSAIYFEFEGTNDTGQTADLDDLGSFIVTRNGNQIANVSIAQIARMLDINRGSNLFSSTEAGAVAASAILDFALQNDAVMRKNALEIAGQSELNLEYVPASTAGTVFAACTLTITAELSAYSEKYQLKTLRDNQNEDAAVAGKTYQLNKDNIAAVYMEDPDDVLDLVQLDQSERNVLSPLSFQMLEIITLSKNQLETSTFSMVKIPTYTPENPASAVNYDTILSLTTSGAGGINIVTQSIDFAQNPRSIK